LTPWKNHKLATTTVFLTLALPCNQILIIFQHDGVFYNAVLVIARSEATKQSRIASKGWIASLRSQ
jgi:hypothetical protein